MILQLATQRMLAHVDAHGIGWMTFNNPARHNALSLEMWQGIGDILEHLQNNGAVVMPAAEAKEMGIINFIADHDAIEAQCIEYTQRVAGNAPMTVRAAKEKPQFKNK